MQGIQQQELNGQLLIAAKEGKVEEVNILIKAGASVNTVDYGSKTPLYYAAESGHTEIVKALISTGANVDVADCIGNTSLYCATESGHIEIVKALIGAGAIVDMADCIGNAPLHCATESGHTEIAKALISAGANVNMADCIGNAPLYYAAKSGHTEIIKALISAGADFDIADFVKWASFSAGSDHTEKVKVVIKYVVLFDCNRIKPDFVGKNTELSLFWDDCKSQVKKMQGNVYNIPISWCEFLLETDENKLAGYLPDEKNDMREKLESFQYEKHLSIYADVIRDQINKGERRRYLLNEHRPLERKGKPEETEKNIIDCLKRYYNGSYKLGEDELVIILHSISELKEKEKCKKFKRLLEEIKKEEVKDISLIELLMIKIHRNLGEDEKAWNLYCSFDQESSFYSYAIEEAKQLVVEYQEDSILKGLSSLNISSNGQKGVVKSSKGEPTGSVPQQGIALYNFSKDCKKKSKGFSSVSMVASGNKHSKYLSEEREAFRRHKAESRFFDPERNKKKLEMANFIKEITDHRYQSKEESKNSKYIDLEGKSARFIITAERLFQEKVIGLSNSKQPKLGIPSYSQSNYGRSFTSLGPFEEYKVGKTKIKFQHRTEPCSSTQGISPSPKRLGAGYLKDVGRYNEIYNFLKKLTNEEKEKERKLIDLMIEYVKSHKPITLDKLSKIYAGANESDIDYLHKCCFLVLGREQAQWHSATRLNHESLHLGMSVIQARCFLLLKKGFLNFKQVFMNGSQFGVYSHKNILSNLEKVRRSCKNTEDLYKVYRQSEHVEDCMESPSNPTYVLTTKQAHKDLKEIYGGESDTSGEEYSTDDSSSISPCGSLDSLEVKGVRKKIVQKLNLS